MPRDATATARRPVLLPRTARGTPTDRTLRLRALAWRLRILVVAVCVGIAASLVVGRLAPAPPETVRVPVAARALAAGTVLGEREVELREVPAALVPTGVVRSTAGPMGTAEDEATNATSGSDRAGGSGAGTAVADEAVADEAGVDEAGVDEVGAATTGTGGTVVLPDADDQGLLDGLLGGRLAVAVPEGLPLVTDLLTDPATEAPAGTVVVPVRFGDPALAALLAPGTRVDVVAASMVDGVEPERVAVGALVLGLGASASTGASAGAAGDAAGTGTAEDAGTGSAAGLLAGSGSSTDGTTDGPVLLAVSPAEALRLSGAAASDVLSAVIVG